MGGRGWRVTGAAGVRSTEITSIVLVAVRVRTFTVKARYRAVTSTAAAAAVTVSVISRDPTWYD